MKISTSERANAVVRWLNSIGQDPENIEIDDDVLGGLAVTVDFSNKVVWFSILENNEPHRDSVVLKTYINCAECKIESFVIDTANLNKENRLIEFLKEY